MICPYSFVLISAPILSSSSAAPKRSGKIRSAMSVLPFTVARSGRMIGCASVGYAGYVSAMMNPGDSSLPYAAPFFNSIVDFAAPSVL